MQKPLGHSHNIAMLSLKLVDTQLINKFHRSEASTKKAEQDNMPRQGMTATKICQCVTSQEPGRVPTSLIFLGVGHISFIKAPGV